jgi:hypothetical protein
MKIPVGHILSCRLIRLWQFCYVVQRYTREIHGVRLWLATTRMLFRKPMNDSTTPPAPPDKVEAMVGPFCQTCGSKTVMIRGRYPRDPEREVCPTCLAERMDTIREVADRDYGRAYQVRPNGAGERPLPERKP